MADKVEQLKALGNKQFASGDHAGAVASFSEAINVAPDNHILYSNRSAAYASLKEFEKARADAERCVQLQPQWSKGYGRLGAALHGLSLYDEALKDTFFKLVSCDMNGITKQAYRDGLGIEPGSAQLKKGLEDVERAKAAEDNPANVMNKINTLFQTPDLINRILANPRTAAYMAQPDFVAKLQELQADGNALSKHLSDQRVLDVLTMLIAPGMADPPGGAEPMQTDVPPTATSASSASSSPSSAAASSKAPEASKSASPKATDSSEETAASANAEEQEARQRKAKALAEKELGTQAYRKREFDNALKHYNAAMELDPDDITYLNNISAVHFEMGDFDKCIKTCESAVEKGREVRADYKLIARALGRIGSAYQKLDKLPEAITFFNKSLTEHRTPEILAKLQEVEKEKKKRDREAYIDPVKADEEREKGNAFFKSGDWPNAVACYSEAINRSPSDPRGYTNRAAAYTKLMAFMEASKDCEEAIRLDSKYVKAYIRKANVLLAMKKFQECMTTLEQATEFDTDHKNQAEITQTQQKCFLAMRSQSSMSDEEVSKNAERDPEVMAIMADPVMRAILAQMQSDPKAIIEHMKNPSVAAKLQKLMDAGIIRLG